MQILVVIKNHKAMYPKSILLLEFGVLLACSPSVQASQQINWQAAVRNSSCATCMINSVIVQTNAAYSSFGGFKVY